MKKWKAGILLGVAVIVLFPRSLDNDGRRKRRTYRLLNPTHIAELAQALMYRYSRDPEFQRTAIANSRRRGEVNENSLREDHVYNDFWASLDAGISRTYEDRWNYHDSQIKYASTSWNHEHLSIGSLDFYGRAPSESTVRNEFATQVFRMRMDKATREYFAHPNLPQSVKTAGATLEQMKNTRIQLAPQANKDDRPTEIRVGWDPTSDSSKIEYQTPTLMGGIYCPKLLNSLLGGPPTADEIHMRMEASFGKGGPAANVSYRLNSAVLEAGLANPLAPSWMAHVSSIQPLRPNSPVNASYEFRLSYSF